MNTDDFTQSLESVIAQERACTVPITAEERRELFGDWCALNPDALSEMELTALAIDRRGLRVSTKYLIEKQRYEGSFKLNGVPFRDQHGLEHCYCINNSDTACLARWLVERHPGMNIELRKSVLDKEGGNEG